MPSAASPASAKNVTEISLLAAVAANGVIGRDGALPWHLPADLKRFRQLTLGHPVVMGRKTYDSILKSLGKPLPGRENIVVTRAPDFRAPGCRVAHSIEAALTMAKAAPGGEEIFVIGGAEIYSLALPHATRLDMTEIGRPFEGDARFPAYDRSEWREVRRENANEGGLDYAFVTYQR